MYGQRKESICCFLTKNAMVLFLTIWVFGFFAWTSFDLFVEAHVFEWLQWNGCSGMGRRKTTGFLCGGGMGIWLIDQAQRPCLTDHVDR